MQIINHSMPCSLVFGYLMPQSVVLIAYNLTTHQNMPLDTKEKPRACAPLILCSLAVSYGPQIVLLFQSGCVAFQSMALPRHKDHCNAYLS
jgi:hypothetical protein